MTSIVLYLAQAVGMIFYPFRHLGEYILSLKDKRSRNVFRLLAGACAAIPAVIFLCVLLSGALVTGHVLPGLQRLWGKHQ